MERGGFRSMRWLYCEMEVSDMEPLPSVPALLTKMAMAYKCVKKSSMNSVGALGRERSTAML